MAMQDETTTFADFIRRIRAGDEQAAEELVRQYEPAIRLEVRVRLRDQSLYRLFDSVDICQSVMASFFVRAALGQYELEEPKQLVKLLVGMTRNKLAFQVRHHRRERRDHRRASSVTVDEMGVAAKDPTPSELVAGKELLSEFHKRLTTEERQLAELRAEDCPWGEIAARLGGTPEARRKQLERAVDRVSQELGLGES